MDLLNKAERYTIEDIYRLPDDVRAQLINGTIYYMDPPGRTHQRISMYLAGTISNYIASANGRCEVYAAPFGVFINKDDYNYLEPDLSVICDLSKLDEKGCHGAPDWVIEIVSPASKTMDYLYKLFKYQTAGVREYWIVDPLGQKIMVYNFEKELVEHYSFGEDVPVYIFEGFIIKTDW